jgi:hypothetical protein
MVVKREILLVEKETILIGVIERLRGARFMNQ